MDALEQGLFAQQFGRRTTLNKELGDNIYQGTLTSITIGKKAPSFTDLYLPLLADWDQYKEIKGEVKKGDTRRFFRTLETQYNKAITDSYEKLAREGAISDAVLLTVAEIDALAEKIDNFESFRSGVEVSGPLSRLVPSIQFFHPLGYAYDHIQIAFALDVASILNRGRPSDKDMTAALNLVPSRTDSEEVTKIKFEKLRNMMLSAKKAINAKFPVPMSIFDTGDVDQHNIPIYDFTQAGSMVEGGPKEKLISTWQGWLTPGNTYGDAGQRQEAMKMLKAYGISGSGGDISPDEDEQVDTDLFPDG
tara:strand:- start:2744 stop:3661 length:918 start_codon:yes stop_codon:yes gene_type:complete